MRPLARLRQGRPEANPIVVKELRQAVRSRFVISMLMVFLFIQLATAGWVLVLVKMDLEGSGGLDRGRGLFQTLLAILSSTCMLAVPIYTAVRLSSERSGQDVDLFYATTIRPSQIVAGKLVAGMAITLLLFGVAMPFMTFSYLLRGIDLPTIFVTLLLHFAAVLLATLGAIFLGSLPVTRAFKVLLGVGLGWGMLGALVGLNAASHELVSEGIGSQLASADFWQAAGLIAGISLTACVLLFTLAVALLRPPSANRALPVRIVITTAVCAWAGVTAAIAVRTRDSDVVLPWLVPAALLMGTAFLVAMSESATLSLRVRRAIPRHPLLRLPAFLFFSGPAGGICWFTLVTAAMLGLCRALQWHLHPTLTGKHLPDLVEARQTLTGLAILLLGYGMLYLLAWRVLLRSRPARAIAPLAVLLLVVATSLLPVLVEACSNDGVTAFGAWAGCNPVAFFFAEARPRAVRYATLLAALAFALNLPWLVAQVRAFRPPPPQPPGAAHG